MLGFYGCCRGQLTDRSAAVSKADGRLQAGWLDGASRLKRWSCLGYQDRGWNVHSVRNFVLQQYFLRFNIEFLLLEALRCIERIEPTKHM